MSSLQSVLISLGVYALLIVVIYFQYSTEDYGSGNDAAGAGMARGYAALISFAIVFVISIIITIINFFLTRSATHLWIKLIGYIPIILVVVVPVIHFVMENVRVRQYEAYRSVRNLMVTCEVKLSRPLEQGHSSFRTDSGSSGSRIESSKTKVHEFRRSTNRHENLRFSLSDSLMQTERYFFEMDSVLELEGFTDWVPLTIEESTEADSIEVLLRYKVDEKDK